MLLLTLEASVNSEHCLYLVRQPISMNERIETLRRNLAGSYRIRILLGSLLAAIVADGVITRFLVINEFAYEGNPVLHFYAGQDVFLIIKLLGGFLATFYLWGIYKRQPKVSICCSSLFLIAYTFIIFWNLLILF
jgi:hypothetical protein